ncbi:MAG TPA: hypothetical protein VIF32_05520 [Gemmatimonadaceae bacterium]
MMRILIRFGAVAASAIALGACNLEVQNPNSPETKRVLATPTDVESLLANYYLRWHSGMYGSLGNVWGMASVQAFENYSSLNNNQLNARAGIPRPSNDNSPGNSGAGENLRVYAVENEVARVASSILTQFDQGLTLGDPGRNFRARAFGEFLRGVALGYLAMTYDSSAVIAPGMSNEDPGQLRGYAEVMDSALAALTRSIAYAPQGAAAFPLPANWIPSSTSFTLAEFVKLARSYKARLRANVARTPAERAAVDWTQVIADATNGITADHDNITNPVNGPFNSWVSQFHSYGLWHQMTPFVIGMADVSGAYDGWIKTTLDNRNGFHMETPDLRFPQGTTRAQQQADFAVARDCNAAATPCKRYFRNRPAGEDQLAGLGWGLSEYDFVKFHSWRNFGDAGTARSGKLVFMTKAEMDLLAAEGYYRKVDYANAAALINVTRTRGMVGGVAKGGGLPAVTATVDGGLSGANCVPKKPFGEGPSATITCGDLWEALKYEKRIETAYTHFAAWLFDMRGWGDLAVNTPLDWAPPYDDLLARGRAFSAIYNTGGGGNNIHSAAKGTYGW